jgi:hypothetical protein
VKVDVPLFASFFTDFCCAVSETAAKRKANTTTESLMRFFMGITFYE